MTLKSALQDVKETTLAAVSGLLGKLAYLASLRRAQGRYEHWGMELVHGPESSERALQTVHAETVAGGVRVPRKSPGEDPDASSRATEMTAQAYGDGMRDRLEDLLPGERPAPVATHLNSVLLALSMLQKNRGRATRSIS